MTEIPSSNEVPDKPPASSPRRPASDDTWEPWGTSEKQKFGQADGSRDTQQF
ncbi:hypothetical protein [Mycobacteroides franklinii]|uniref:Uncharacterized protein n=1 Tax=Mycobacteroides franklinii TaxID=948102 RepID=A0A4R8RHU1_9MYCO|nr:hypothetical protein [Mycobacteroides franklinii]TDZ42389.1 hypothetical protein CCUG64054_02435 [Mycobacteroides franklinii]TDZ52537.1 hypothetical protein CCUG63697_01020 [Mycobacteroides franklinii]TDZ55944.1 hypothetical protein CCUG63696_02437 [Mycobacteroides franklinii]TDZ62885.1 hypothetical protein CCUG63695_02362 [Mycobacteroides franklinii]TDZ69282.1 hypothetical protein CCUG64056_02435 [Mycobacteroides franklinii]